MRIVQLNLPALSAAVVFTERLCGIGKGRTKRFYLLFLLVDFLVEDLVSRSERLGRFIVLVELRIHKLHFRTKHFERIVDFSEGFLEFLFALKTYFQAEILGHSASPPRKKGIKKEPCGSGGI